MCMTFVEPNLVRIPMWCHSVGLIQLPSGPLWTAIRRYKIRSVLSHSPSALSYTFNIANIREQIGHCVYVDPSEYEFIFFCGR